MNNTPRNYQTAYLLPVFQEPVQAVPLVEREPIDPPEPEPAPRHKRKRSSRPQGDGKGIERFVRWYRAEGYKQKFKERPPDYPTF